MTSMLRKRLSETMLLTDELGDIVGDDTLASRLGGLPSNSIGSQFWCIVGARESYARAIEIGRWSGFSCTLSKSEAKQSTAIRSALERSRTALLTAVSQNEMTDERTAIAFDVLEHEAMHQGQLVRYFYANEIAFPQNFAQRYALAQPTGKGCRP